VIGLRQQLKGRALAGTEPDRRPEFAPQRHRLRVMIAVHVGDEEFPDIGEVVPERAQRLGELCSGLPDRPAGVDQHGAVVTGQRVDVHRPRAIGRQRKRDPVDSVDNLERARGRPVTSGRLR